jgi:hypothetical protein
MQPGPRPREPLAKRHGADPDDLCCLLTGQAEDITEDVRQALIAIKTEQHALRAAELDLLDQ